MVEQPFTWPFKKVSQYHPAFGAHQLNYTYLGHVELSKYLIDIYPKAITQATKSGRLPTQAAAALIQEEKKDDDRSPAFVMTTYLLSHTTSSLQTLLLHRDNSGRNVLLDSAVSQNLHCLNFYWIKEQIQMMWTHLVET